MDGSDSIPILKLDEKDPLYDDFDDNAPGKAYVLVSSDDKNAEDEAGAVRPNGFDPVANKAVYGPMLTLSEFKFRVSEVCCGADSLAASQEFGLCNNILNFCRPLLTKMSNIVAVVRCFCMGRHYWSTLIVKTIWSLSIAFKNSNARSTILKL